MKLTKSLATAINVLSMTKDSLNIMQKTQFLIKILSGNLPSAFFAFCKRPLARKAKPGEKCPSCKSPLQSKNTGEALTHDYHRSADRIKKSGTLRYYSSWPQKGKEAILLDLSPKGIRFLCNEELEQESIIKLSSHLLKAIAKVVNTQREEVSMKTSYTVGAHFLTVTFANPKGSFFSSIV
jgi:hypothetical protein